MKWRVLGGEPAHSTAAAALAPQIRPLWHKSAALAEKTSAHHVGHDGGRRSCLDARARAPRSPRCRRRRPVEQQRRQAGSATRAGEAGRGWERLGVPTARRPVLQRVAARAHSAQSDDKVDVDAGGAKTLAPSRPRCCVACRARACGRNLIQNTHSVATTHQHTQTTAHVYVLRHF